MLSDARRAKKQLIANAKCDDWHQEVYEVATSPKGLWRLARWAYTKSYLLPELNKIPDLQTTTGVA